MIVGIVGSEAKKFTPWTEGLARVAIRVYLRAADVVVSGHSPLGGIDWWAIEEAEKQGIPTREYKPARNSWEGGFKDRNLLIARNSDLVVCIVVKALPPTYRGRRFEHCYHHAPPATDHIKSGGCWTLRQAARLGKQTRLVIVE